MYALKNKVQLIGRLGNQPEIKEFDNNKKVAKFSIATQESYRSAQGEKITDTTWHTIVAWGKLADLAEKLLIKGCELAIEGKLVNRNYVDKLGIKRFVTEIQISELLLIGNKATA